MKVKTLELFRSIWPEVKFVGIFIIPILFGILTVCLLFVFIGLKLAILTWLGMGFLSYIGWPTYYLFSMRKEDWIEVFRNIWMIIFGPFNIIFAMPL